uniref:Lysocardiolipin acyltransferase 1 n=1 Tax=Eptatretus burgeri TaxID=7764 RepID=A0A8C4QEN2_EPTBU
MALVRVSLGGLFFILVLFLTSIFGSVFMLGPVLPLMLVSPAWYRWITDRIVAVWLTLPVALLEVVFHMKVVVCGDGFWPGERSIIIMNHRTRLDWMFLWSCLLRSSYLRQEKICLKSDVKHIPGFGWAMQVASFIFIDRKWEVDKKRIIQQLDYFRDVDQRLQLLFFPEGTDLTPNTSARSNEFADRHGLQRYEYVLHPRTTGFVHVVQHLRSAGTLDCIHDVTLAYPNKPPQTELDLLGGLFPQEIHFLVRRYAVAALPYESVALTTWCQNRWQEKEAALQRFYTHGVFSPPPSTAVPPCKSERRVHLVLWFSLLYWGVFVALVVPVLLWHSVLARWFFLIISVFFTIQPLIGEGLQQLEISWYRRWTRQPKKECVKLE